MFSEAFNLVRCQIRAVALPCDAKAFFEYFDDGVVGNAHLLG
jgi:hypothetical protein